MANSSNGSKLNSSNGSKLNPATAVLLRNAIDKMEKYYAPVLAVWHEATPEQKQAYLDNSPVLRELLDWSAKLQR